MFICFDCLESHVAEMMSRLISSINKNVENINGKLSSLNIPSGGKGASSLNEFQSENALSNSQAGFEEEKTSPFNSNEAETIKANHLIHFVEKDTESLEVRVNPVRDETEPNESKETFGVRGSEEANDEGEMESEGEDDDAENKELDEVDAYIQELLERQERLDEEEKKCLTHLVFLEKKAMKLEQENSKMAPLVDSLNPNVSASLEPGQSLSKSLFQIELFESFAMINSLKIGVMEPVKTDSELPSGLQETNWKETNQAIGFISLLFDSLCFNSEFNWPNGMDFGITEDDCEGFVKLGWKTYKMNGPYEDWEEPRLGLKGMFEGTQMLFNHFQTKIHSEEFWSHQNPFEKTSYSMDSFLEKPSSFTQERMADAFKKVSERLSFLIACEDHLLSHPD